VFFTARTPLLVFFSWSLIKYFGSPLWKEVHSRTHNLVPFVYPKIRVRHPSFARGLPWRVTQPSRQSSDVLFPSSMIAAQIVGFPFFLAPSTSLSCKYHSFGLVLSKPSTLRYLAPFLRARSSSKALPTMAPGFLRSLVIYECELRHRRDAGSLPALRTTSIFSLPLPPSPPYPVDRTMWP